MKTLSNKSHDPKFHVKFIEGHDFRGPLYSKYDRHYQSCLQ